MTSTRKATRVRIGDAGDSIRRREAFVAGDGSLTGEYLHGAGPLAWGHAPDSVTSAIRAARATTGDAPLYVVLSYRTPIGWAGPGEALTVPAVTYSPTTSRHQGIARRADWQWSCRDDMPGCSGGPGCDYFDSL